MRLAVANCNGGSVSAGFAKSLAETLLAFPGEITYLDVSGPYLAANRNALVEAFLASEWAEWILMVDSDVRWSHTDVERLLDAAEQGELSCVSGLYFSPCATAACPVAWGLDNKQVPWRDGGLIQAKYFGAGFLLMRRDFVAEMHAVYDGHPFAYETAPDYFVGEDIVFCRRARAVGHELYVNCDVIVGHEKPVVLLPSDYLLEVETTQVDPGERVPVG